MAIRVAVAMSGGVDSSVAAALLKERGYEVIGLTICFGKGLWPQRRRPVCCGQQGIADAQEVAAFLGIPHYVVNLKGQLERYVVENFLSEYTGGRTPNPCIRCNQYLKFGALLEKAGQLGARYLATGHYARIAYDKKKKAYLLKKGVDPHKDQSYFLCSLSSQVLASVWFPLGGMRKEEVRQKALALRLPVADKPASQDICFLPCDDYRQFIKERCPERLLAGPIVDERGNVLGRHEGIGLYTIGQRQGLRIAAQRRLYVIGMDSCRNFIQVGPRPLALSRGLVVSQLNVIYPLDRKTFVCKIKIRYNHTPTSSRVYILSGRKAQVIFSRRQFAVTPGQAAVFYQGSYVLGGGTIERSLCD